MSFINFYERRIRKMLTKGELLYNINNMKVGCCIKIYSKDKDVFDNEKIDIYTIERCTDGIYVKYTKKRNFDCRTDIVFREKVIKVGVNHFNLDYYKEIGLTKTEIDALKDTHMEEGLIRYGYPLEGKFESGLEFTYPNIILVTTEKEDTETI